LFKKKRENTLEKPLSQSSIKQVYLDIQDGQKTLLGEDQLGLIYLGKAVFKNQDRMPVSIKIYHIPLEKDVVKEYLDAILILKELKKKKDILFNTNSKNVFLKLNFLKTQTERHIEGEWVYVSYYHEKKNFEYHPDLKKIKIPFEEKKEELVWIFTKFLENRIYPTNQLILEFLNIDTKKNINLDKIVKERDQLKNPEIQFDLLMMKLKWLAREISRNKKNMYDCDLYELCDVVNKYSSFRKIKNKINEYKKKIRFEKA